MSTIVGVVHPHLKGVGFRKRRNTFNRSVEDGVVQVVGFQMGAKFPPGAEPIPGLRPDLYGLFTVNLGVGIREVWERLTRPGRAFPEFINDYDCHIRERLGQVMGFEEDVWWPLGGDLEAVAETIVDAVTGPGLAWLETRATRSAILQLWSDGGQQVLPMPTALPVVLILRQLDRNDEAGEALRSYYRSISDHSRHQKYVFDVAQSLGIGGLAAP